MAPLHFIERGSGPVLVFIHGFPLDCTMWRPQIDTFSATHRVLAPDLPGFGQSPSCDWSIESAADILNNWLESLGISKCALVGLSMGGYIALALARRHAGRLSHLVLANTKATPDDARGREGREAMIQLVSEQGATAAARVMMQKLFGMQAKTRNPKLLEEFFRMMSRQKPESVIRALRALRDRPDARPGIRDIRVPTLVITGSEDSITPESDAAAIFDSLDAKKSLRVLAAGHISNREDSPGFRAAIRDLMA